VVAKGYRPVIRDQGFLLPPDMRDWLPADHPVWLVIEAVGQLDTSAFHARRKTGGAGAAGFDPDMLVTLLIWAYANEVTSSRRVERLCGQDVAFRVICAGDAPDHTVVARFRKDFADAVPALFAQVLGLCGRLGMGKVGVVALDGTKIAANASKAANRTEEGLARLAEEAAARHAAADAEDDALFGQDGAGDDDPGDPSTRAERVAAALASARAEREAREAEEHAKAEEHVRAAQAGTPKAGRPPVGTEVELARQQVARETAARQARIDEWERRRAAGSPAGRRPAPPEESGRVRAARERLKKALALAEWREATRDEKAPPEPVRRNVTDPDSRLMPVRGGGFIQGYNPQNVTSSDGLIIATRLTQDTTDVQWYQPMTSDAISAAAAMAAAAGHHDAEIGLVLADAGYLSHANLTSPGPDRLIATGKHRALEKTARASGGSDPGSAEEGPVAAMAARLATPAGITAYRQRGHIAETPHGNIKHNLGFRQLSMRGLRNASAEWQFACTVHNLLTAITSGHLTRQALQNLAT
jgi:transposase